MSIFVRFFSMIYSKICSSDDDDDTSGLLYNDVNSEYNDYVSVCGIKWARGNLQHLGEEWKIADHQWEYFNYVDGNTGSSVTQSSSQMDHFNWGVCGVNALTTSFTVCAKKVSQDISGKMFTDVLLRPQTFLPHRMAISLIGQLKAHGGCRHRQN